MRWYNVNTSCALPRRLLAGKPLGSVELRSDERDCGVKEDSEVVELVLFFSGVVFFGELSGGWVVEEVLPVELLDERRRTRPGQRVQRCTRHKASK